MLKFGQEGKNNQMGKMKAVLGLRLGPGHDTGAALVCERDGELRCVAIAQERLSRQKNSREFPEHAIQACLGEFGLEPDQLDAVVFEKTNWAYGSKWYEQVPGAHWEHWTDPKERAFFASAAETPCYFANHHLLHAASAWHTTDWAMDGEPGALLVIDGRGSTWGDGKTGPGGQFHTFREMDAESTGEQSLEKIWKMVLFDHRVETQSIFVGRGRTIERKEVSLCSGVGLFYAWLTECVLGFGHMHAGKTMGLAAYGQSQSDLFEPFPDELFDGIDTDLMGYIYEHLRAGKDFRYRTNEDPTDPYFADAAAWGQRELLRAVMHLARRAIEQTGARRLGFAGGVALNVVANRQIHDELLDTGKIDDFFVQPAASDAGLALGAALFGYYNILEGIAPFQKNQVYLGPTRSAQDAAALLVEHGGKREQELIERVADLLLDGKIVGWFQGRSEHGPRALGARSILCWPRPDWMKDHINARVKHREAFRPFAPIVQEEHASEAFDADFAVPYMLINTMVREQYRERIPAVTHADGSGRLQTVSSTSTPLLYDLLGEIRARDGVGVLLNTSFNDNGEPIVETVEDAIRCFQSTNIDALVCSDALIVKPE